MALSVEDQRFASEIFTICMRVVSLDQTWTARLDSGDIQGSDRDELASIGYLLASELEAIHGQIEKMRRIGNESQDPEALKEFPKALGILSKNIDNECKIITDKVDEIKSGTGTPKGDIGQFLLGSIIFGAGVMLSASGGFAQRKGIISSQSQIQIVATGMMTAGSGMMAS
ncbi:hypothetical protein [Streptomyces pristinaespiralis]|uniref:hypothetical protein n=1 Tax=Streptomyces pristinaespiralis TaxID=38300 RepID=UPI0033EC2EEA